MRRSRFLATLGPAPHAEAAHTFIQSIRREFPDATHNCWAFAAGPPGDTAQVGMSDDGEPHGTAGRPMLNVLLHSGVGEVVAVVTRTFGGVKLGKGGLGRAYAGAVQLALEGLPTVSRVWRVPVRVRVDYGAADALFRLLDRLAALDREEDFSGGSQVEVRARVAEGEVERLRMEVAGFTQGTGRVEVLGEPEA